MAAYGIMPDGSVVPQDGRPGPDAVVQWTPGMMDQLPDIAKTAGKVAAHCQAEKDRWQAEGVGGDQPVEGTGSGSTQRGCPSSLKKGNLPIHTCSACCLPQFDSRLTTVNGWCVCETCMGAGLEFSESGRPRLKVPDEGDSGDTGTGSSGSQDGGSSFASRRANHPPVSLPTYRAVGGSEVPDAPRDASKLEPCVACRGLFTPAELQTAQMWRLCGECLGNGLRTCDECAYPLHKTGLGWRCEHCRGEGPDTVVPNKVPDSGWLCLDCGVVMELLLDGEYRCTKCGVRGVLDVVSTDGSSRARRAGSEEVPDPEPPPPDRDPSTIPPVDLRCRVCDRPLVLDAAHSVGPWCERCGRVYQVNDAWEIKRERLCECMKCKSMRRYRAQGRELEDIHKVETGWKVPDPEASRAKAGQRLVEELADGSAVESESLGWKGLVRCTSCELTMIEEIPGLWVCAKCDRKVPASALVGQFSRVGKSQVPDTSEPALAVGGVARCPRCDRRNLSKAGGEGYRVFQASGGTIVDQGRVDCWVCRGCKRMFYVPA